MYVKKILKNISFCANLPPDTKKRVNQNESERTKKSSYHE